MQSGSFVEDSLALSPFPPQRRTAFHEAVLDELAQDRVVSSRGRRNPRAVKKSVGKYPIRARCQVKPPPIDFTNCVKMLK